TRISFARRMASCSFSKSMQKSLFAFLNVSLRPRPPSGLIMPLRSMAKIGKSSPDNSIRIARSALDQIPKKVRVLLQTFRQLGPVKRLGIPPVFNDRMQIPFSLGIHEDRVEPFGPQFVLVAVARPLIAG